jgi:hypothetical protein
MLFSRAEPHDTFFAMLAMLGMPLMVSLLGMLLMVLLLGMLLMVL